MLAINLKYKVGSEEEKKVSHLLHSQVSKGLECCSEYAGILPTPSTVKAAGTAHLSPNTGI